MRFAEPACRGGTSEANVYLSQVHLRRLETRPFSTAAGFGPTELRTLDAVHLVTALDFSRCRRLLSLLRRTPGGRRPAARPDRAGAGYRRGPRTVTCVFDLARELGHERVVIVQEPAVGLRAVIAIHDTTLGTRHRRHAHAELPRVRGCRRGRPAALARDDREGGLRRHALRRRQGGDLRRPAAREDAGAAPRFRPRRRGARRAFLHRRRHGDRRRGSRHHGPGHESHRPYAGDGRSRRLGSDRDRCHRGHGGRGRAPRQAALRLHRGAPGSWRGGWSTGGKACW